jgi:hypothetical protein
LSTVSRKKTQHRIAEIPMQQWHRARGDPAPEAIAHDELRPIAQLGEKRHE